MIRPQPGVARLAAPAAFLLAFTVAILLIRSGLSGSPAPAPAPIPTTAADTGSTTTTPKVTLPPTTPAATTTQAPAGATYEIQAGDTLEIVAGKYSTTVEQLLTLNPDVDPVALQVGQKIRVP